MVLPFNIEYRINIELIEYRKIPDNKCKRTLNIQFILGPHLKKQSSTINSMPRNFQDYFRPDPDEEEEEEALNFYKTTNKLMEKEIETLKYHVKEAEQDITALQVNETNGNSTLMEPEYEFEEGKIKCCKIDSTENDFFDYQKVGLEEEQLKNQIRDLARDILGTKKEMDNLKKEEEYYKNQVEILNQIFLHVLDLDSDEKENILGIERHIDIERVFADSDKISKSLNIENDNSEHNMSGRKEAKDKMISTRRVFGATSAFSHGFFSIEQAEMILRTLKREKKYLDETNLQVWSKFLEKLVTVLLQKLNDKERQLQTQEKKGRTLKERINYLEKYCHSDESDSYKKSATSCNFERQSSLPASTIFQLGGSSECEEVKIDFEQPVSLINPNYIPPSDQI